VGVTRTFIKKQKTVEIFIEKDEKEVILKVPFDKEFFNYVIDPLILL
jgi:hypothetical protein